MRRLCFSFMFLLMLIGCSQAGSQTYDHELGYKKSDVNEQFLVPGNAEQQEANFNNPNYLKGAKYKLINVGGSQGLYPPHPYFQELEKSGWSELEDKRMGHVHFFSNGDTIMSVVIKQDFFEVYELKQGAKF
ncbi:hypothetical protein [Paenibacillus harenae]|uniref:hypothetical protein n=1 Tax=Paenibacillus harenae TaxID=306543 RepID=UPI0004050399|nr:hypothetical protein [Paenibacillus harenae]